MDLQVAVRTERSGKFAREDDWRPSRPRLSIAVVIATCGRPSVLAETLASLRRQSRPADEVIVCAIEKADLENVEQDENLRVVFGPRGLSKQRNVGLASLSDGIDIVVFFDDDFLPHPGWLEAVEHCFVERATVSTVTGFLLADGVCQGGIAAQAGWDLIEQYRGEWRGHLQEGYSPYGCNMAFRRSAIRGLRFDERLVLYGWLEDRDFGATVIKRGGRQIKLGTAVGVHLGVNRGRVSGRRFGYSQIINPIYIFRKSNMSFGQLAHHVLKNVGMNSARCLFPENHIDRAGRLLGNLIGFFDALRGIIEPERTEQLH